jgi:RNA polymerase sigma-70 factor (TIGR02960 family)
MPRVDGEEPLWGEPPVPAARIGAREAISLAFVTALQRLPPRQRAVLLLCDVVGYPAAEVAEMLGTSGTAVDGLLRRARAALEPCRPPPADRAPLPGAAERALVGRFVDAFSAGDVDGVVALLSDDAWLTMPPEPYAYQGREAIGCFLTATFAARRSGDHRLVPSAANGQPAFGHYVRDPESGAGRLGGLLVLTLGAGGITALTRFADTGFLRHFRLPPTLRW